MLPICVGALALGLAAEAWAPHLFPLQGAIVGIGLFQGGIGTTIIALLALLTPEERRAPVLNFALLPSQLSWFIGPITGAGLATISLRAPFAVGAGAMGVALVLSLVVARSVGHVAPVGQAGALGESEPVARAG